MGKVCCKGVGFMKEKEDWTQKKIQDIFFEDVSYKKIII